MTGRRTRWLIAVGGALALAAGATVAALARHPGPGPRAVTAPAPARALPPASSAPPDAEPERSAAIPTEDPGPDPSVGEDVQAIPARGDLGDAHPGTLHVNALPWGNVAVDGRAVGETPVTLALAPGRHRVRVTHPSFGARETAVLIRSGHETSWTPNLMQR